MYDVIVIGGSYAGLSAALLDAARAGLGLACVLDDTVEADLAEGRVTRVLADWCPPFSGYHLYYRVAASSPPRSSCSSARCASRATERLAQKRAEGGERNVTGTGTGIRDRIRNP